MAMFNNFTRVTPGPLSRKDADTINRALELLASINKMDASYPLSIQRGYGQQPLFALNMSAWEQDADVPDRILPGTICPYTNPSTGEVTIRYVVVKANGDSVCVQTEPCTTCESTSPPPPPPPLPPPPPPPPPGEVTLRVAAADYPAGAPIAGRTVDVAGTAYSDSGVTDADGVCDFTGIPSSAATVSISLSTPGGESASWTSSTDSGSFTTVHGFGFGATNSVDGVAETFALTQFSVVLGPYPPPFPEVPPPVPPSGG